MCVNRLAAGVAECTMTGHIVIGEFSGPARPRDHAIAELFVRAGVKMSVSDSLAEERCKVKLMSAAQNDPVIKEAIRQQQMKPAVLTPGFGQRN